MNSNEFINQTVETIHECLSDPETDNRITDQVSLEMIYSILNPLTDKRSKEYVPRPGTFDLLMLIEEIAELKQALRQEKSFLILEELADVYLCLVSFVYITGIDSNAVHNMISDSHMDNEIIHSELDKSQQMISKIIRRKSTENDAVVIYVTIFSVLKSIIKKYEIIESAIKSAIYVKLRRINTRIENGEIN